MKGKKDNDASLSSQVKNDLAAKVSSTIKGMKVDDASITSQVRYALRSNLATSELETTVITNDGRVTITGEAKSDAEKSLISKFAQDVRGTKSVTNSMTVKS